MSTSRVRHSSAIVSVLRLIAFLPGILLQLVGMLFTLLGWSLMALGLALRLTGGLMAGMLIVTRGLFRALAALRP